MLRSLKLFSPIPLGYLGCHTHVRQPLRHSTSAANSYFKDCFGVTPSFAVKAINVKVLKDPSEFFNTLKSNIDSAKDKIVLASLYLGVGHHEKELVSSLLAAVDRGVSLHILLDALRGTRGHPSSASMLAPLLSRNSGNAQVSMYHTPRLRGVLKKVLPARFNEIVGVQHIKVYACDDNLILSGANLSDQYFEDRQDRYVSIKDQAVADYFADVVKTVMSFSLSMAPSGELHLPSEAPDMFSSPVDFEDFARMSLEKLLKQPSTTLPLPGDQLAHIYPCLQMGLFGMRHDEVIVKSLLESAAPGSRIELAAGYLNFPRVYEEAVLTSRASFTVMTAHPKANSFYKANGISKYIPDLYTAIEKRFFELVQKRQKQEVNAAAAENNGFESLETEEKVLVTCSGLTGQRSETRDIEAQAAIVTDNADLRRALAQEHDRLLRDCIPVTHETFREPDRALPWWLPMASAIAKTYL